jgi:hypothetical protein
MAVPTTITNLSVTASSNSPAGSDSVTTSTGPDEYFRALSAIVRRGQASSTLASAGSLNLGGVVAGDYIDITGTTSITSFGTIDAGIERTLIFSGALTLTHNSTSLILPTGANITTVAGDVFTFRSEGSGNWRCTGSSRDTPLTGAITTVASGASSLGSFTSAQLASALTNETGSGAAVFGTSPTLITPALGTPASGTLTNCTFPTLNQNTTGTAAGLSVTLAIGSGGTGQTTALIPSGTKMLFVQASAPVGWTQITSSVDNKALRVVSGSGGGTGGSVSFTSAFASHTPAGTNAGTAISIAQMPSHTHTGGTNQYHSNDPEAGAAMYVGNASNTSPTASSGGGATHTHTFTGVGIDLRVQYHDTIICSKD